MSSLVLFHPIFLSSGFVAMTKYNKTIETWSPFEAKTLNWYIVTSTTYYKPKQVIKSQNEEVNIGMTEL